MTKPAVEDFAAEIDGAERISDFLRAALTEAQAAGFDQSHFSRMMYGMFMALANALTAPLGKEMTVAFLRETATAIERQPEHYAGAFIH